MQTQWFWLERRKFKQISLDIAKPAEIDNNAGSHSCATLTLHDGPSNTKSYKITITHKKMMEILARTNPQSSFESAIMEALQALDAEILTHNHRSRSLPVTPAIFKIMQWISNSWPRYACNECEQLPVLFFHCNIFGKNKSMSQLLVPISLMKGSRKGKRFCQEERGEATDQGPRSKDLLDHR